MAALWLSGFEDLPQHSGEICVAEIFGKDEREAAFAVDDKLVRRCARPPTYPLQLMLAVFDFP